MQRRRDARVGVVRVDPVDRADPGDGVDLRDGLGTAADHTERRGVLDREDVADDRRCGARPERGQQRRVAQREEPPVRGVVQRRRRHDGRHATLGGVRGVIAHRLDRHRRTEDHRRHPLDQAEIGLGIPEPVTRHRLDRVGVVRPERDPQPIDQVVEHGIESDRRHEVGEALLRQDSRRCHSVPRRRRPQGTPGSIGLSTPAR